MVSQTIKIGTMKKGESVIIDTAILPEDYKLAPNGNNFLEANTNGLDIKVYVYHFTNKYDDELNWVEITNKKVRVDPTFVDNKIRFKVDVNEDLKEGDSFTIKIYRVFEEATSE